MSQWTYMDPGAGSLATLMTSAHSTLPAAKSSVEDVKDGADAARALVTWDAWSGSAGTQWRTAALALIDSIPTATDAYDAGRRAIVAYTDTVGTIKTNADHERTKLTNAVYVVRHLKGLSLNPIDNAVELAKLARAELDIVQAEAALLDLGFQRQSADDTLVGALAKALPPTWEQQRKAFQGAGLTSTMDLTPSAIAAAMADIARRAADGSDPQSMQELDALLDIYGTDEQVMSQFFAKLGGAETVNLINSLGDRLSTQDNLFYLELAQKLRLGLSIGSQQWGERFSAEFTDDMFNGTADTDDPLFDAKRIQAIAYLFSNSDTAPMGEHLTLATALAVDAMERPDGSSTAHPYDLLHSGGSNLYAAENPDKASLELTPGSTGSGDEYYSSGIDLAGEVFETLGHYPDSALDFISPEGDPTLAAERAQYWFGERDWSVDKFEGISDLWTGAEQAAGGPYSDPPDSEVSERLSLLASQAIWGLSGNESFITENMSEEASATMAAGIAPYLDGIADYMLRRGNFDPDGPDVIDTTGFGGMDGKSPLLSDDVLSIFLSEVGSHDAGAAVIQQTIESYQTVYLGLGLTDPSLFDEGISRSTWLQGALDGSGITGTIEAAERYDAKVDEAIDNVMKLVNLIPIPMVSKLVEGGSTMLDIIQKLAVAGGKSDLVGAWKDSMHTIEDVTSHMSDARQAQATAVTLSIANQLELALGRDLNIPDIRANETPDHYAERVDGWWAVTSGKLQDEDAVPGLDIDKLVAQYLDSRDASSYRAQG